MGELGLAAVIAGLRAELTAAIDEGAGKGMQFVLAPVELTLQAVVTNEGNGKVGWKVMEVGGSHESATTQVLKLTLTPLWKKSDGTLVSDFTIAAAGPGAKFGPQK